MVEEKSNVAKNTESEKSSTKKPKTKKVKIDATAAIKAAEAAEAAAQKAIEKATIAKSKAEDAAEAEYKAIADQMQDESLESVDYTFKRKGEEIFRRDMGEPEFFLDKKDRFPRPILSSDEQESLTRKAEIPQDQTPAYTPEHVLSPEFGGVSNYERGVDTFLVDTKKELQELKKNPDANPIEIQKIKNRIIYLESLHENFYLGMNVFRTAKGGRSKLQK